MPTSAVRMGRFIEFKFRGDPKLFFLPLSKNCLMVHDYCVDSSGCAVYKLGLRPLACWYSGFESRMGE
jgi:hypothetical protein